MMLWLEVHESKIDQCSMDESYGITLSSVNQSDTNMEGRI